MLRLGIFLALIGFVSVGFHFSDYQLRYLMWAEDYQPFFGIGLGLVGLALVAVGVAAKNKKKAAAPQQPLPQQP